MTGTEAMNFEGNSRLIDVNTLQPGVYFLRIAFTNGNQQLEKIVKL